MSNLLINQYGKYKRVQLDESPYKCLLDTNIEITPHQVNAFYSAIKALKTGGIILADEVGLGKTIEAGLILKYMIDSGAKKIMLTMPASLRKQWEVELNEKFNLSSDVVKIIDRAALNYNPLGLGKYYLLDKSKLSVVITSYDFSSKLMKLFPSVKWDFLVIDEAHNMRNIFHGTKRAKRLYDLTKGIPKILLTATPLQNKLTDLYGLATFIDGRIFGSEKTFVKQYETTKNYALLKKNMSPILYRTLRSDVQKYIKFAKRECRTFTFALSRDEMCLYERVNEFLQRPHLYSLPDSNRNLMTLVVRKLLASSSFALVETFEVMRTRLQKLYEGTKSTDASEDFDFFLQYLEDEIDEIEEDENPDIVFEKQQIEEELREVGAIIADAKKITENAKIKALRDALGAAFSMQKEQGIPEKAVIFTESKRTQKYIREELISCGYDEDDIVLFNGDNKDEKTKEIYRVYKIKNHGGVKYSTSVEMKHAIVDYFEHNAKILILTDAGSEGLNLQFCNSIINYDLPWNPMKIEQRIGRCHRYGQQNTVVALNLLNTSNAADQRVYDILSNKLELFNNVFGSSDIALGVLESGMNFEQEILRIYQECKSSGEIKRAFDKFVRKLETSRNKRAIELRSILLSKTSEEKCSDLDETKLEIDKYLSQVEYWDSIEDEDISLDSENYWQTPEWGMKTFGSHGYMFIGMLANQTKLLFPVLLVCDEDGNYIDFNENELLPEIEKIEDTEIFNYTFSDEEHDKIFRIYDRLTKEMIAKYSSENASLIEYQKQKIDNWVEVQIEQLNIQISEMAEEIKELLDQANQSTRFYEKVDLKKEAETKMKTLTKYQEDFHKKVAAIREEGQAEINEFNNQFEVDPFLWIRIVLKF